MKTPTAHAQWSAGLPVDATQLRGSGATESVECVPHRKIYTHTHTPVTYTHTSCIVRPTSNLQGVPKGEVIFR